MNYAPVCETRREKAAISSILIGFQRLFFNRTATIRQLTNSALFVVRCPRRNGACQVSLSVALVFVNSLRTRIGDCRDSSIISLYQVQGWREPAQPIGGRFTVEDYSVVAERLTIIGGCGGARLSEDLRLNRTVVYRIILYMIPVCFCGQPASWDDLCVCLCRSLQIFAGGNEGWSGVGGGSGIWFNHDLILQLNFVPGEEDVRQKRINMKNMFPYVCPVHDNPSKLAILFEARQIVAFH